MSKPLPNPIVPGIYRTRCGGIANITATDPAAAVDDAFPVVGRHGVAVETWTPEGKFIGLERAHPFDLVEHLQLAPDTGGTVPIRGSTDYPARAEHYPKPLDRRTRCAMAALQGLLADSRCTGTPEQFVKDAVRYADALLAELEPKP